MHRELKIDLVEADIHSFIADKGTPPNGVIIKGPICTSLNAPGAPSVAAFLLVTVPTSIAINLVSNWLYDHLMQRRAKRVRINGREPKDKAEFDRIIREEIEVGKND